MSIVAAIQTEAARQQARAGGDALGLIGHGHGPQQHTIGPVLAVGDHIHAVMDAMTDVNVEAPGRAEQRFVGGGAAPVAMAGGLALAVGLGFHHQAPEEATILTALPQHAAHQVGAHPIGRAREKGRRQDIDIPGIYGVRSRLTRQSGW